eukprot:167884_1
MGACCSCRWEWNAKSQHYIASCYCCCIGLCLLIIALYQYLYVVAYDYATFETECIYQSMNITTCANDDCDLGYGYNGTFEYGVKSGFKNDKWYNCSSVITDLDLECECYGSSSDIVPPHYNDGYFTCWITYDCEQITETHPTTYQTKSIAFTITGIIICCISACIIFVFHGKKRNKEYNSETQIQNDTTNPVDTQQKQTTNPDAESGGVQLKQF